MHRHRHQTSTLIHTQSVFLLRIMTSLMPSSLFIFHPSLLSQSPLSLNLSLSIFNISRLSFSETKWGNWLHFSLLTLLRGVIQGTARALVTSRLKNHLISLKFNNLILNNVLGLIFNVKYLFLTCEISENHTCKYHLDVSALKSENKTLLSCFYDDCYNLWVLYAY